jgi:hypothetical protein
MKAKYRRIRQVRVNLLGLMGVLAVLTTAVLTGCGSSGGSESSSKKPPLALNRPAGLVASAKSAMKPVPA